MCVKYNVFLQNLLQGNNNIFHRAVHIDVICVLHEFRYFSKYWSTVSESLRQVNKTKTNTHLVRHFLYYLWFFNYELYSRYLK